MRQKQSGQSLIELVFIFPLLLFLFIGVFDWGFYAWSLITTENAARAAALYTSSSAGTAGNSAGACTYALAELAYAPNVGGPGLSSCSSSPLTVTASAVTGPDGADASQVSVAYQTMPLIPIPGLLTGQITITRAVVIPLRG